MSGLRPISLCFVFYKIITKTLSQRLKLVLPFILSPTQSAFVSKRLDHGLSNFSYTYYVLINDKPHGFIVPQRLKAGRFLIFLPFCSLYWSFNPLICWINHQLCILFLVFSFRIHDLFFMISYLQMTMSSFAKLTYPTLKNLKESWKCMEMLQGNWLIQVSPPFHSDQKLLIVQKRRLRGLWKLKKKVEWVHIWVSLNVLKVQR